MRGAEANIYSALATLQNGQIQSNWSRGNLHFIFHTIALPLVIGSTLDNKSKFGISVVGIALAVIIPFFILRGRQRMRYYYSKLAELERLDLGTDNDPRVSVFSDRNFEEQRSFLFSTKKLWFAIWAISLVFWTATTIWYGIHIF